MRKDIDCAQTLLAFSDGASFNNGKEGCVGGYSGYIPNVGYTMGFELDSSSQRAEILGVLSILNYCKNRHIKNEIILVTDSGYVHGAITGEWYKSWSYKGWVTSTGEPVKNRDLWEKMLDITQHVNLIGALLIKGHIRKFKTESRNEQAVEEAYEKFITKNELPGLDKARFLEYIEGNEFVDNKAVEAKDEAIANINANKGTVFVRKNNVAYIDF